MFPPPRRGAQCDFLISSSCADVRKSSQELGQGSGFMEGRLLAGYLPAFRIVDPLAALRCEQQRKSVPLAVFQKRSPHHLIDPGAPDEAVMFFNLRHSET